MTKQHIILKHDIVLTMLIVSNVLFCFFDLFNQLLWFKLIFLSFCFGNVRERYLWLYSTSRRHFLRVYRFGYCGNGLFMVVCAWKDSLRGYFNNTHLIPSSIHTLATQKTNKYLNNQTWVPLQYLQNGMIERSLSIFSSLNSNMQILNLIQPENLQRFLTTFLTSLIPGVGNKSRAIIKGWWKNTKLLPPSSTIMKMKVETRW